MNGRGLSRTRRALLLMVVLIGGMTTVAGLASPGTSAPADTASWLPPETLSTPGRSGFQPEIGVDGQGDVVAVWIQSDGADALVHTSSRPAGGVWSTPVPLSEPGRDAEAARVAVNARGDAVAVWFTRLDGTKTRVESAFRPAGGDWSGPLTVSDPDEYSSDARVAIDSRGNAVVVWTHYIPDNASTEWIETASRSRGGSWSAPVALSEPRSLDPHVVVDTEGNALAVWTRFDGTNHRVQSADRPAGGSWSTPVDVSVPGQDSLWPEVALDGQGNGVAAWIGRDAVGQVVLTADRSAGGAWSAPVTLSEAGRTALDPELAVGDQGNAVVAWRLLPSGSDVRDRVQAADRPVGEPWRSAVTLSTEGLPGIRPDVAIDRWGNAVAVWLQTNGFNNLWLVDSAELSPGGAWRDNGSYVSDESRGAHANDPRVTVDEHGNAVAAWWYQSSGGGHQVHASGLDRAGPVSTMAEPSAKHQTARGFLTAWSALDTWSEVADFDVRYRTAPYDSGFGPKVPWLTGTTTSEAPFRGAPGVNYCFSARAKDTFTTLGAWAPERCTTTPVDDRTLAARGGWTRVSGRGNYLSTVTTSQRHGAVLKLAGVQARRLDLLVTRRPGAGAVTVGWNGTTLGTFDLASPTVTRKHLMPVMRFQHVRTGVLHIRIVSPTGKPVLIDGVVASRR